MRNGVLMATNLRICWHAVVSTHSNDCSSRPMLQHLSKPASDLAGSAAAPVQMPLPPTLAPSQATAVSASQAANGQADAPQATETVMQVHPLLDCRHLPRMGSGAEEVG